MPITARYQSSWTERNIDAIVYCFDNAFATVLDSEFKRIRNGKNKQSINRWLCESEASINLLMSGRPPNYADRMVCLRYLVRYQLRQINLAYSLVKGSQRGIHLVPTKRLRVVDFGAGSMAMAFGVVLAIADALESGEEIDTVFIDNIDTSMPMMELGLKLLDACYRRAKCKRQLKPFVRSRDLLQNRIYTDWRQVKYRRDAECWLSALHAIYQEKEADVSSALSGLIKEVNPSQTFLTFNDSKEDIAKRIWPLNNRPLRSNDSHIRLQGKIENSVTARRAKYYSLYPSSWSRPNLYAEPKDSVAYTFREPSTGEEQMKYHARIAKLAADDVNIQEQIKALQNNRSEIRDAIKSLIGDEPKEYIFNDAATNTKTSVRLRRSPRKTVKRDRLERLAVERFGQDGAKLVKDSTEISEVVSLHIKRL